MYKNMSKYSHLKIGKLKVEKALVDRNEFRRITTHNRSGKIVSIKNYKNNKLSGKIKYYWPNGEVHLKGQYINGMRSGTFTTYSKKGDILLEEKYSKLEKK